MNFNRPGHMVPAETDREPDPVPEPHLKPRVKSRWRGALSGAMLALMIAAAIAYGGYSHYAQSREVAAIAKEGRELVPPVRGETVRPSDAIAVVTLPPTTSAFSAANIFARASRYIAKRDADICHHEKGRQLPAGRV